MLRFTMSLTLVASLTGPVAADPPCGCGGPPAAYAPAPAASYYAPPVSYYADPAVSYYAPPVSYYAAPGAVTTTRYGLFGRPRYTTTYVYP